MDLLNRFRNARYWLSLFSLVIMNCAGDPVEPIFDEGNVVVVGDQTIRTMPSNKSSSSSLKHSGHKAEKGSHWAKGKVTLTFSSLSSQDKELIKGAFSQSGRNAVKAGEFSIDGDSVTLTNEIICSCENGIRGVAEYPDGYNPRVYAQCDNGSSYVSSQLGIRTFWLMNNLEKSTAEFTVGGDCHDEEASVLVEPAQINLSQD